MNLLLIITGIIFLICMIVGYVRGVLKIGISLVATIATIALVIFLTPYAADALHKWTPVDEMIEKKCIEIFSPSISPETLANVDLTGTPLEGLSAEAIVSMDEKTLEDYGVTKADIIKMIGELPKDMQIKEIEGAQVPQFLKKVLLENNNSAIYQTLGVQTFVEYVASYISRIVINILSFLVSFLLITILVKALIVAVDLLSELPVLGGLNRLAGALVGFLIGLLVVWVAFLVLTLCCATDVGKQCFAMIEESRILTFLYEKNILLNSLVGFK